jgi:hypothetical protein
MRLDRLLDPHLLTGVVLGGLIGLVFPLDPYKPLLVILAVVLGIKLVSAHK